MIFQEPGVGKTLELNPLDTARQPTQRKNSIFEKNSNGESKR